MLFRSRYGTAIIGRKVTNLPPPGNPAANLPVADFFDIADKQIPGGVSGVMVTNPNRDNAIIKFNGGRTAAVTFTTKSMVFDAANPGGTMLPSQKTWFQEFYNVNAGLHFAFFGGTALRLLYFICSAAGTMLIACGVVKFTSKRRTKEIGRAHV